MIAMPAAINTDALLEVVYASVVLGLVLSIAFSLLLYGAVRSADHRRDGSSGAALAFGLLAVLGATCFATIVAYGFYVIIAK